MTRPKSRTSRRTQLDREVQEAAMEGASKLAPRMIYEVIRRDGEEELNRPNRSLFWSGVAAGIMISFSVLAEAVFRTYLPDADWRFLVENLGYALGFILVIMGRMQLFTENTISTVLPLISRPYPKMFAKVARLWSIVLGANLVGAFAIATLYAHTPALPETLTPALISLSEHAVKMPAGESFFRAIPAGILVAAIVWMLPQAEDSAFFVILTFAWLIAAGDFTHIVAGSVEMAYLAVQGMLGFGEAVFGFFLPVLAGNIIGGTAIFALMAWGQVKDEI
ncbi:formate/nitrite transporter family protein [Jannaschia sp. M317]|uniref:formate/nitrite transporter family protein n=1 Tax=Jannaschia sp. M317 TaxID=2867011 RepID=UPI0021A295E5|nr:formate/nitrite transporter family protein [Jannaschia sp. M317]UWQ18066.1 formate/nitrite transporter family protein [Jannaschia sp. M317]